MLKKNFRKAFTLIELSIILAVISIILVGMVSIYSSKDKNLKSQQNSENIKIVYQALQKYLAANKYLPCPASLKSIKSSSSDYGFAVTNTNCVGVGVYQSNSVSTLVYGMVPTATLGLDNKFAEDAYGNKLVYVTDYRLTNSNDFESNIKNSNLISISGGASVSNAIFVVMSRGSNSSGAFPANSATMTTSSVSSEQSNDISNFVDNTPPAASTANFSGIFIQSNSDSNFDDVIFYKTREQALSENAVGSKLIPCTSSDSTESLYGTFITWPKAYEDQIVAAQTACPSPNWNGSVVYPTKKCGTNGQWSSVTTPCTCSSGYSESEGDCVMLENDCTFSGITGIADGTQAAPGTRTKNCDSNYEGSVNYTCSNETITINSGSCSKIPACTGGSITTISVSNVSYKVHTFTSSDTLSCSISRSFDVLIVGGGGGGGREMGGGGGGGGVVVLSGITSGTGSMSVNVGSGAPQETDPYATGRTGSSSTIVLNGLTYTALGGGGGGGANSSQTGTSAGTGGGGGAGSSPGGTGYYASDDNSTTFGNNGGDSTLWQYGGGGGGGAGTAGGSSAVSAAGSGGDGYASTITGETIYYGGGGGGGTQNWTPYGSGGRGGGGRGSYVNSPYQYPVAGTNGLGGGGGGCGRSLYCTHGAAGGSGVVIVRYPYTD